MPRHVINPVIFLSLILVSCLTPNQVAARPMLETNMPHPSPQTEQPALKKTSFYKPPNQVAARPMLETNMPHPSPQAEQPALEKTSFYKPPASMAFPAFHKPLLPPHFLPLYPFPSLPTYPSMPTFPSQPMPTGPVPGTPSAPPSFPNPPTKLIQTSD
ncbi:hypothetical protein SOVF_191030 [Spinacia oleracea]|nr:hypothetical protein SOVF_191030 [Spinacia oleracea]